MKQNSEKEFHSDFHQDFKLIGQGTYGVVYRMRVKNRKEFSEEEYAVKIMESSSLKAQEQINKELQILFQLSKISGIIQLAKVYVWKKEEPVESMVYCLVMDLADRNLQQEIDMRKMNMRQFNECELENIFRSCIEVFRHIIKEKQIFHRDIKPENILFAKEGSLDLKITDFGVSKYLLAQTGLDEKGTLVGTPAYLSPALWRAFLNGEFNQENVGKIRHSLEKSDVYSLGITLLQATLLLKNEVIGLNKKVKYPRIKEMLERMLVHDENQRLSFEQLQTKYFPKPLTIIRQSSAGSSPMSSFSSNRSRSSDGRKIQIFSYANFSPQLAKQKSNPGSVKLNYSNLDSTLTPPKQEICTRHKYAAQYYLINEGHNKTLCDKCYDQLPTETIKSAISIREYRERTETTTYSQKLLDKIKETKQKFDFVSADLDSNANSELTKTKENILKIVDNIIENQKLKNKVIVDELARLEHFVREQIESMKKVLQPADPRKVITDQNAIDQEISNVNQQIARFNYQRETIILESNIELITQSHNLISDHIEKLQLTFQHQSAKSWIDLAKQQNSILTSAWKIQDNNIKFKNLVFSYENIYNLDHNVLSFGLNDYEIYYQEESLQLTKRLLLQQRQSESVQLNEQITSYAFNDNNNLIIGTLNGSILQYTVQLTPTLIDKLDTAVTQIIVDKQKLYIGTKTGLVIIINFIDKKKSLYLQHPAAVTGLLYFDALNCLISSSMCPNFYYNHNSYPSQLNQVHQLLKINNQHTFIAYDNTRFQILVLKLQRPINSELKISLINTIDCKKQYSKIAFLNNYYFFLNYFELKVCEKSQSKAGDFQITWQELLNKKNYPDIVNMEQNNQQNIVCSLGKQILIWKFMAHSDFE